MPRLTVAPEAVQEMLYHATVMEDFCLPTTANLEQFLLHATDSTALASLLDSGRPGGNLQVSADNATNDESYVYTNIAHWNFAAPWGFGAVCRFDWAITTTDATWNANYNMLFGFLGGDFSGGAADLLIDDGGGPVTGVAQALIFKTENSRYWRCGASLAADANPNHLSEVKAGRNHQETSTYQSLMITAQPTGGGQFLVNYFCDPVGFGDFRPLTDDHGKPISDYVAQAAGQMGLVFGGKDCGIMYLDYLAGWATRRSYSLV